MSDDPILWIGEWNLIHHLHGLIEFVALVEDLGGDVQGPRVVWRLQEYFSTFFPSFIEAIAFEQFEGSQRGRSFGGNRLGRRV